MSPRPILVTGAVGFLGTAICRRFATSGDRVLALIRPGTTAARRAALPGSVELFECDLVRQPERLAALLARLDPAVVVHAAVRDAYAAHDLAATVADNVTATANLLAALAALERRPRLVALGGSTEYGRAPGPISERTALAPITPRGATKAAASLLVLAEHAAGRVEAGVLRPFTVYGPGEPAGRLIPTAIRAALTGAELPLAPTAAVHDLVFVDDVAEACRVAAAAPGFPGAAWNVCSGQPVTNRELLAALECATGRTLRRREGALPARPLDRPDWFGDPRATLAALGWRATTPLAAGLAATVAFWRDASASPPTVGGAIPR